MRILFFLSFLFLSLSVSAQMRPSFEDLCGQEGGEIIDDLCFKISTENGNIASLDLLYGPVWNESSEPEPKKLERQIRYNHFYDIYKSNKIYLASDLNLYQLQKENPQRTYMSRSDVLRYGQINWQLPCRFKVESYGIIQGTEFIDFVQNILYSLSSKTQKKIFHSDIEISLNGERYTLVCEGQKVKTGERETDAYSNCAIQYPNQEDKLKLVFSSNLPYECRDIKKALIGRIERTLVAPVDDSERSTKSINKSHSETSEIERRIRAH